MWQVNPQVFCKKHLLGEHGELYKHHHIFVKQYSIDGRIFPEVQIEPASMQSRHDKLAQEMLRRGYRHQSPYEQPDISYLPEWQQEAKVDIEASLKELARRCPVCRERIQHYG